jgi:hypothetical protein
VKIRKLKPKWIGIGSQLGDVNELVVKIGVSDGIAIANVTINGIEQSAFTTTSKLPVEFLRFKLDKDKQKKKREFPFRLSKFKIYATPPFFKGTFESKK